MTRDGERTDEAPAADESLFQSFSSARRSLAAGVTAIGAALAGCSGGSGSDAGSPEGDSGTGESGSGDRDSGGASGDGATGTDAEASPESTSTASPTATQQTPTADVFDGVSFDGGDMFIHLKSDAEVDFVTLNTPHGDRFGRDWGAPDSGKQSIGRSETSAGPFPLDPAERDQPKRYDPGTYTAHAYQERQLTATEDGETAEETEVVEVGRTEIELSPEVTITSAESGDSSNQVTFTVENTGSGPAAVNVIVDQVGDGPAYNNKLEGTRVGPGETVQIEKSHVHEYGDNAENSEICGGETVTREATLLLFERPVTLYTVDLTLDGEVNESITEKTCTEATVEVTDERSLPEKTF